MLPQGALLTIEAKDFAGLLKRWSDSPEKAAWLKSDNFGAFSRSRLFGRLGDAQTEFARAAGLPPDLSFLNEVAGRESVFAWYDIGQLEFLYMTRLPSGSADKTRLMQMRGKFSARKVGEQTFYVRSTGDGKPAADAGEQEDAAGAGQPRTVAFATSGDWLLLSTREDLMAGALTLMAAHGNAALAGGMLPISDEPWFAEARAEAAKEPGELRMMLNLEKIVRSPYFRSYWIQRNVTETAQYRSAVADLYLDSDKFREERVLLPKNPQQVADAPVELSSLTELLPQHAGVYRAVAAPAVSDAVASLDEKLLRRGIGGYEDTRFAPVADTSVAGAGSNSESDLETRIDEAPLVPTVAGAQLAALRRTLESAELTGMMTVSRTSDPLDGIWVPFQSAVVLSSAKEWDAGALQTALREALAAQLTASGLGLAWKPVKTKAGSYSELSETRPLEMAVRGRICILADNAGLMREMLGHLADSGRGKKSSGKAELPQATLHTTLIADFDLPQERPGLDRWSKLVDRTGSPANAQNDAGSGNEPSFFSQNMLGLTEVLAPLESEHMVESKEAALTRQTVVYAWRP